MHAHCPDQILTGISPQHPDAAQNAPDHLAYQAVTAAAILLFLISFWAC